ncbi:MAG: hypothetical protein IPN71_13690 [Fibrobacteres bacterium]|nr:hypothetical protein [Fibrobacterota bacterium]
MEALVACIVLSVCMVPLAAYLYKARWNQAGVHRFDAERVLDSLVRSEGAKAGGERRLEIRRGIGVFVVQTKPISEGHVVVHGTWSEKKNLSRELWLNVHR